MPSSLWHVLYWPGVFCVCTGVPVTLLIAKFSSLVHMVCGSWLGLQGEPGGEAARPGWRHCCLAHPCQTLGHPWWDQGTIPPKQLVYKTLISGLELCTAVSPVSGCPDDTLGLALEGCSSLIPHTALPCFAVLSSTGVLQAVAVLHQHQSARAKCCRELANRTSDLAVTTV